MTRFRASGLSVISSCTRFAYLEAHCREYYKVPLTSSDYLI